MKYKQFCPGFELGSLILNPTTIIFNLNSERMVFFKRIDKHHMLLK